MVNDYRAEWEPCTHPLRIDVTLMEGQASRLMCAACGDIETGPQRDPTTCDQCGETFDLDEDPLQHWARNHVTGIRIDDA